MRDRRLAVTGHGVGGGGEHCELVADRSGVVGERAAQRPRRRQLGDEELGPRPLVELGIRGADAGDRQQLADDAARGLGRVLAHIETAQVLAERHDLATHRARRRRRRARRRRGIARSRRRRRGRRATRRSTRRRDQGWRGGATRSTSDVPASVRSARANSRPYMPRNARRYGSSARNGEPSPDLAARAVELGRRRDQPVRHRQRSAELVEAAEMELVGGDRLPSHSGAQHVGGDEWIAVTVAADPRAHTDHPAGVDRQAPALVGELLDGAARSQRRRRTGWPGNSAAPR